MACRRAGKPQLENRAREISKAECDSLAASCESQPASRGELFCFLCRSLLALTRRFLFAAAAIHVILLRLADWR